MIILLFEVRGALDRARRGGFLGARDVQGQRSGVWICRKNRRGIKFALILLL